MISQFYLGDKEIVHLILSLQDTNNWSLRRLQPFLKTIFQTLCANLSVSNSYHDHYSLLSSSYYLHNDSLFLEEHFLSKQNVEHPYLISLEFRSIQSNILN